MAVIPESLSRPRQGIGLRTEGGLAQAKGWFLLAMEAESQELLRPTENQKSKS